MPRPRRNHPMPGLYRVPKDPTKPLRYWTASIEVARVNGVRQPRKERSSKDWDTAYRYLKDMLREREENPELTSRSATVAQWSERWMTVRATKVRPKTSNNERSLLANHVIPVIGAKKLDHLTVEDVRKVTETVTARGRSSTTSLAVYRLLHTMLKSAAREGLVARNVAEKIDAPRKAYTELTALDAEQALTLLTSARASGDRYWTLWATVLLTGARQGELLGLQRDHILSRPNRRGTTDHYIDLEWQLQRLTWQHGCTTPCGRKRGSDCQRRKIDAPADWKRRHLSGGWWLTAPKTSKGSRTIPLVEPLRSILAEHLTATANDPNPYGLVWTQPSGNPVDPRIESEAWHAALDRAGLPDVRLHGGRHTTVDLLFEAGVPEDLISDIVGHSSRAVTRGYKSAGIQPRTIAAMESLSSMFNLSPARTRAALEE